MTIGLYELEKIFQDLPYIHVLFHLTNYTQYFFLFEQENTIFFVYTKSNRKWCNKNITYVYWKKKNTSNASDHNTLSVKQSIDVWMHWRLNLNCRLFSLNPMCKRVNMEHFTFVSFHFSCSGHTMYASRGALLSAFRRLSQDP